jgi:hypothetical protein
MLGPKRTHRWIAVATAALLSCGPVYLASAAITPPKLGGCKPVADEPPADAKEKATNPGTGNKGATRPAGEKPVKPTEKS